jgi:hypothetical protein
MAALRFLENLHEELCLAQSLSDIQDERILKKMKESIDLLKETLQKTKKNVFLLKKHKNKSLLLGREMVL